MGLGRIEGPRVTSSTTHKKLRPLLRPLVASAVQSPQLITSTSNRSIHCFHCLLGGRCDVGPLWMLLVNADNEVGSPNAMFRILLNVMQTFTISAHACEYQALNSDRLPVRCDEIIKRDNSIN